MRARSFTLLLAFVLGAGTSFAQAPVSSFETASVKPNPAGPGSPMAVRPQNDRLTLVNVPGHQLVQMAFRVDVEQIQGAPSWLANEHFDVTAKAVTPFSTPGQWQDLLRTLLEERFQLRARREPKVVDGFVLTVARADGRLGPALRRAEATCAEMRARPDQSPTADPCGAMSMARAGVSGTLNVHGLELRQLVLFATRDLGRLVIDETGLTGAFDWDLKFTPQNFLGQAFSRERFPTIDPDGPRARHRIRRATGLEAAASPSVTRHHRDRARGAAVAGLKRGPPEGGPHVISSFPSLPVSPSRRPW